MHKNVKVCSDFLNGTEKSKNAWISCIYPVEVRNVQNGTNLDKLDDFQMKYDRNLTDLSLWK